MISPVKEKVITAISVLEELKLSSSRPGSGGIREPKRACVTCVKASKLLSLFIPSQSRLTSRAWRTASAEMPKGTFRKKEAWPRSSALCFPVGIHETGNRILGKGRKYNKCTNGFVRINPGSGRSCFIKSG